MSEEGAHYDNMLRYGCALNWNYAFQVGYFSLQTFSSQFPDGHV